MQLVADANVLLSAVIGGRAALAPRHDKVEQVFTPAAAYDEVFEYLLPLAKKKRLDLDTLLLACAALPVTVVERSEYQTKLSTAKRRIGKRDPDDVDVLALALMLQLPVWSHRQRLRAHWCRVVHHRRTPEDARNRIRVKR